MRLLAHRGLWWPRRALQNHPASVLAALSVGWSVEIDVQGTHGADLWLGHEQRQFRFTLPAWPDTSKPHMVLHVKQKGIMERLCAILQASQWRDHASLFYSPEEYEQLLTPLREGCQSPHKLGVVGDKEALESLIRGDYFGALDGVWLEQPEGSWVGEDDIAVLHATGKSAWVVSPELHNRAVDLGLLTKWWEADGICTDYPHLISKILEKSELVLPRDPWWSEKEGVMTDGEHCLKA